MFTKWFKRKTVPSNDGTSIPSELGKVQYKKVFELELSNMEESPVYSLTNQLTVGSEIGNIIISDPSVSPRHATFLLQDGVVSVIDHGSVSGTSVNGKNIPGGKYIILEEADIVNVGDLEIRLKSSNVAVPVIEELENPESEEDVIISKLAALPKKSIKEIVKEAPSAKSKKKARGIRGPVYSANALIRVVAVIGDFILAYCLLVIFLPFDDFRNFLDFIPEVIASSLDVEWSQIWTVVKEDLGFAADMLSDIYVFLSTTLHFLPLLIVYALLRTISALLFGVSFSQLMLGVRAAGNGVWARIGGFFRELVGLVTGPLIIFDIPSVISRRTLKDFITFTNIQLPSKFLAIIGIILYLPALGALALVSPLLEGLEPPEAILISDKLEQRVKVKPPAEEGSAVEASPSSAQSDQLGFSLAYDQNELTLMPSFKFQEIKNKLNVKSALTFYQRDLQRAVEIEIFKSFDLKQLLAIGMKGNMFLFDKYPQIYNYVYEAVDTNPAFRRGTSERDNRAFANEFMQFTKTAFSLGIDNAFEIMQEETPLIKGLIDYKSSFISLLEYKDFSTIGFIKIGNAFFIKISYQKQRPFDLIIPLKRGQGTIYKVTYDKRENAGAVASRFYKFNLENSNWFPGAKESAAEVPSALEVFDVVSKDNFKSLLKSPEKAQGLYAYYYENSARLLKKSDPVELELWKNKLSNFMKFLESLPSAPVQEGEVDMKGKLLQNFQDLTDALQNSNLEYFGISDTAVI